MSTKKSRLGAGDAEPLGHSITDCGSPNTAVRPDEQGSDLIEAGVGLLLRVIVSHGRDEPTASLVAEFWALADASGATSLFATAVRDRAARKVAEALAVCNVTGDDFGTLLPQARRALANDLRDRFGVVLLDQPEGSA
jgi:hypothetical protein